MMKKINTLKKMLNCEHISIFEILRLAKYGLSKVDFINLKKNFKIRIINSEDLATFMEVFLDQPYLTNYKNSVVIDIGGYKGYFAVYALMNGAKKVISYEFEEKNLQIFKENISINNISNIQIVKKALSNKNDVLDINVYDTDWSHSMVNRTDKKPVKTISVKTERLKEACQNIANKNDKIIIKSNCEGAEVYIFENIPHEVDEMIIAYHSYAEMNLDEFIDMIVKQGFNYTIVSKTKAHIFIKFIRNI